MKMNTMEKLYKSVIENQFKAFDNMLEGITVYKLIFDDEGEAIDGIIEYMNPVTVGTMDINPEDATGKNAMDLFGSDFLKPYFEAINEFLVKGEFKPFEVYYPPTDKYFLVSGFDMQDNLFAILRTDITDRKKAEKALIKSEENYRSIIENLQDGFFRLDKEGKIIMASPSAARIYGFGSVPEMIGMTAIPLYKNVEDRKYLMAELNKQGKLNDYEVEAVKRDGTFIWISLNAQFYYDDEGQIQGIDGFVRDITKRKQAEEALLKAKAQTELERKRLETILETTPAAVVIIEASDGKISYINKRAKQLYGIDITNLNLDYAVSKIKARRIDGSEYPIGKGPTGRALKGETIHNEEMIMEQPDGTVIPILASTAPILNSDGKAIAAIVIFEDITERKQAEEQKQKLLEEVQQFAEELEVSNEELQCTTEELQVTNEELRQQGDELLQINNALHEGEEKFSKAFHANPAIMTLSDARR